METTASEPQTGSKRKRGEETESEKTEPEAKVAKVDEQTKKPLRLWVDGCFDMMHFGHANALRQAKALGGYLIVGVHSDAEILKNKGPTLMKEEERYAAVRACKWVDEVVEDAPYVTQLDVIEKYNVDFVIHGDDITTAADGSDCYALVKAAGKYKEVKRTNGVSTTDIVRRMLDCTSEHHQPGTPFSDKTDDPMIRPLSTGNDSHSPYTGVSSFIATLGVFRLFSDGRTANPTDKVVYVDGAFDLFHAGHVGLLKKAKELGDFLVVGVLNDQDVNSYKRVNYPIMNMYERVLSVLSCRYVDEVVMAPPLALDQDFINKLNISVVVHGKEQPVAPLPSDGSDPYALPKSLGMYKEIESDSALTASVIIDRVRQNRKTYEDRNKKKEQKEIAIMEHGKPTEEK